MSVTTNEYMIQVRRATGWEDWKDTREGNIANAIYHLRLLRDVYPREKFRLIEFATTISEKVMGI